MSRLPDLVLDSRLRTQFRDSIIIHSYLEVDNVGGRFSREEHWKSERFLGRGGFGYVRLEKCIANGTSRNSLRAVKIINKPLNLSESTDFNRELEAISKFSNDRYKRWFVKSFGWFDDPRSIFITMEYCHHGDLHHYLISQRIVAAEEVQQLTYQMLEALDQMHQNDFAHRDLKPGNILIKSMPPNEKWWIVLADFGISKRADESNGPTTTVKGTATFMAPELLGFLDQFRPKSIADFKATDMWALGEIIFQMLTGEATFQNPMELMTYCLGQRRFPLNRLPTSVGDDCHELVTSIMTAFPHDRMTTAQSLQHRWMGSLR
ncbi:kinase-like domain-containing protein, partial [Phaeosphaeriaceae sp. PMI808]